MRKFITVALGPLALLGCGLGEGVGSWRDATFGLVTEDEFSVLERIMESADDTPGSQSLLYTAMVEAEAAAQSATRAVAFADQPAELETALGEVIYAIAPEAAPDWDTKTTGLVPGWAGQGYGVIRASERIEAGLRAVRDRPGTGQELAAEALVCVGNTTRFAREALELARSLLAGRPAAEQAAVLPQLERLSRAQLNGLDADGDGEIAVAEGECALQQARRILEPLSLQPDTVAS